MAERPIIVLSAETAEDAQRVARSLLAAWPCGAPPEVRVLDLHEVLADPALLDGAAAVVLNLSATRLGSATALALTDALQSRALPLVLLTDDDAPRPAGADPGHALLLSASLDPASIAASLHALTERQRAVDELRAEISAMRRFQAGLRGQIEQVEEELRLAALVQRDLLPQGPPAIKGVDLAVMFRPCGYVSGDLYDIRQLDEHRVGVFIADAIGHGIPAALMTMVLARGMRMTEPHSRDLAPLPIPGAESGFPPPHIVPPSQALSRLNREMISRQGPNPRFATAIYAVLDTRDMTVRIASAGHPSPLLVTRSGATRLRISGALLGVFPDDEYEEATLTLAPGEVLVFYSDGFETAFPPKDADAHARKVPTSNYLGAFADAFGPAAPDRRAWRRLASPRNREQEGARTLDEGFDALRASLDQQVGSLHQNDDLTAIAIRRSVAGEQAAGATRAA